MVRAEESWRHYCLPFAAKKLLAAIITAYLWLITLLCQIVPLCTATLYVCIYETSEDPEHA